MRATKVTLVPSFIKNLLRWRRKRSIASFRVEAGPVLSMREGEAGIVTYTLAADKMKVFSAFIREGLESGEWIFYLYPDEERETVRTKLEEHGINVEKHERDGILYMKSLTEHFMPDGNFDKEGAIQFLLNRRAEAKRKRYNVREVEDVGDFSFLTGQCRKYFDYWRDPKWGLTSDFVGMIFEPFIKEVTAVNVGGMSEAKVSEILKAFGGGRNPPTKFIDLLEYADAFSKKIDITHKKLLGHKFLLEFDPVSNYEKVVGDFAKEALANLESTIIFTSSTSVIHACLAKYPVAKFFLMSVSASIPKSTSENKVLLPAKNVSLILDTLSKVLETCADVNVCFVFDVLSELLTSVGQEKTYLFLRHALGLLASKKATALFLLNTSAHEPKVVSHLREAFSNQLTYEKDGLKAVKIS